MIDKEKVLHGLNSCGFYDGIPNICEVTECPYRDNKAYCVHELAHDAGMLISELLKAQEPRVMTFEEAATLGRNTVVWYEFNGENSPRPRIVHHADKAGIQFIDGGVWHFVRDEYGKLFRLWTSRPTAAEREAAPWN